MAAATPKAPKGTILVTGSNGDLGSAIARHVVSSPELAAHHALYTVRNASSPNKQLRSALEVSSSPEIQNNYDILSLDLARLSNVREVATTINERVARGEIAPIRVLVLIAGFCEFKDQTWTDDGFDMSFAANYMGHWLLTLMLLKSIDRDCGRVVVIGSDTADPHNKLNSYIGQYKDEKWKTIISGDSIDLIAFGRWSTKKDDPSMMSGLRRYGAAKMCAVMMISELQRRLDMDPVLNHVTVVGVNPGNMFSSSGISRRSDWFSRVMINGIILPSITKLILWFNPNSNGTFRTTERSAKDIMAAAMDTSLDKEIYMNGTDIGEMSDEAKDSVKRGLLWRDTVRYTKLNGGETALANWE